MAIVKISSQHQVTIPKEIRNKLKLRQGQKMQIFQVGERVELISLKNIKEARGFLKNIDTNLERDRI
jgi:AbrB family looped-hinge helix DNA binding protein